MKRLTFEATVVVLWLYATPASAICQKCNNDYTLSAMCWTIGPCDGGATMGACVVGEQFNADGSVRFRYCDGVGSSPGPECNGNDPSCGGGGGGGGGTGGDGGGGCVIMAGELCMPECAECTVENLF